MVERCGETPSALSRGEPVETKLHRIARKARNEPRFKFTSLYHLMDAELLRGCFMRLRGDAAAGIDGMTKAAYAAHFERVFRKGCTGPARLIRYADDFVACFATQADAERFRRDLTDRLAKFGLEVEPTKTKVLAFGPHAAQRARQEGKSKPETFDFLGLTHYCGRTRDAKRFRMKRVTARKKFRAKLAALGQWLRDNRAKMRTRALWDKFREKLRGHYAYYGVTDNSPGICRFYYEARRLLFKWLNRRSQRHSMTWEQFDLMDQRFPLPRPRIRVSMFARPQTPVQTQFV